MTNIIDTGIDVNTIVSRRKPETIEEYLSVTGLSKDILGKLAYSRVENWFNNGRYKEVKDIFGV